MLLLACQHLVVGAAPPVTRWNCAFVSSYPLTEILLIVVRFFFILLLPCDGDPRNMPSGERLSMLLV